MDALILAQTVFYAVFSLAIFVLAILLCIVAYYFIGIARHLRKVSAHLDHASEEVREQIEGIIEALEKLPLISYFFKKKARGDGQKKGR